MHSRVKRAVCGWNLVHITIQTGALTMERPSVPVSHNKSGVRILSGDEEAVFAKWNNTDSSCQPAKHPPSPLGLETPSASSSYKWHSDITEWNIWIIFTLQYEPHSASEIFFYIHSTFYFQCFRPFHVFYWSLYSSFQRIKSAKGISFLSSLGGKWNENEFQYWNETERPRLSKWNIQCFLKGL